MNPPNNMKFKRSRVDAFTLVEIMIVVAIIGLMAAMAAPSFVRARDNSRQKRCVDNMRQIDGAVDQYALEVGLTTGDPAPQGNLGGVLDGFFDYLKAEPECPVTTVSQDYGPQVVGTPVTCPNVATATTHVSP